MWNSLSLTFKIYLVVILCGVLAGIVNFRRLNKLLRAVFVLLSITFIAETISRVLAYTIQNSNPAYHFYSPCECLLMLAIFVSITRNIHLRRLIIASFTALAVFSVLNSFFFQTLMTFNSNIDLVKMPVTAVTAGLVVIEKLNEGVNDGPLISAELLVLINLLWFNIASFAFNATHNYFVEKKISVSLIAQVHYYVNLIYYFLFFVALAFLKPSKTLNEYRHR